MTDRGLKDGQSQTSTGIALDIKVIRHYDPIKRDEMMNMYRKEPNEIDANLEMVNAVTDLVE